MPGFIALPLPVAPHSAPRSTIGGAAILPSQFVPPRCRRCGSNLLMFLQFDIDDAWSLPFMRGSHLVICMCPNCNEIPSFERFPNGRLPAQFWNHTEGHFFAALTKPGIAESIQPSEPILIPKELRFEPVADEGHAPDSIRVGGRPFWLQDPEHFVCACGSEMAFISQIAENFAFDKQADAPEQRESFSANDYCLFLGNEIYIFGCPAQCDPRAVWITVQG